VKSITICFIPFKVFCNYNTAYYIAEFVVVQVQWALMYLIREISNSAEVICVKVEALGCLKTLRNPTF